MVRATRKTKVMGNKVFVGGLSWDATDDDLKDLFGECGTVTDGVILQDRETGRSRGFGFVTFSSDDEAKAAIEKFHDFEYMGRNLTVNEARPREDRGGGGGGGFRGGGGGGGYRGGGGGGGGRGGGGRGGWDGKRGKDRDW
jgi:cold-inducible RNA-binding protein